MNVSATSILTAGSLFANIINTSSAGNIVGSANINFNLTGDLQTLGDASFTITNSNGGMIGVGRRDERQCSQHFNRRHSLRPLIDNSGGTIGGSANLAFNLSGQLATQSDTSFTINNSNGGMIGVDAAINVTAANISTGGTLYANILTASGAAADHRRKCQGT